MSVLGCAHLSSKREVKMPQATSELRALMELWFGSISDGPPASFLRTRGYEMDEGFIWRPPVSHHSPSRDELACLRFLGDEWDYGYRLANLYPEHDQQSEPRE